MKKFIMKIYGLTCEIILYADVKPDKPVYEKLRTTPERQSEVVKDEDESPVDIKMIEHLRDIFNEVLSEKLNERRNTETKQEKLA